MSCEEASKELDIFPVEVEQVRDSILDKVKKFVRYRNRNLKNKELIAIISRLSSFLQIGHFGPNMFHPFNQNSFKFWKRVENHNYSLLYAGGEKVLRRNFAPYKLTGVTENLIFEKTILQKMSCEEASKELDETCLNWSVISFPKMRSSKFPCSC